MQNFGINQCLKMSSSLCPHLVQEYFERVSDILTTYRLQILKQVEYDKISENLVLRGALRPEEHERIFQCKNGEGRVSQMLVVIQNRMWGLENLLAVFMEENISPWLSQEIFRAYNEHLVVALKHQRNQRLCQCVRMSNSIIYKGWVTALKSLDSLVLQTGTLLGFINQSLYPNDNMFALLSEKLAEITGGDSQSTQSTDLVPYGFSPNSAGEVQVAELEEDDINDLISLSETLCVGYPSSSSKDEGNKETHDTGENDEFFNKKKESLYDDVDNGDNEATNAPLKAARSVNRNTTRKTSEGDASTTKLNATPRRRSSVEVVKATNTYSTGEKHLKQRDLISRLSTPKGAKPPIQTPSKSSSINRHQSIPAENRQKTKANSQRPKSLEYNRSVSIHSSSSANSTATSSSSNISSANVGIINNKTVSARNSSASVSGKTTGFIRSKSTIPTSPKAKLKLSPGARPTAVTKPTVKIGQSQNQGKLKQDKEASSRATENENDGLHERTEKELKVTSGLENIETVKVIHDKYADEDDETDDYPKLSADMSTLFFNNIGSLEEQQKNLGYYQLNFDEIIDD